MNRNIQNITIADKIRSLINTTPSPDTSSVPISVNGSPGDSTIGQPDLTGINSAGPNIEEHQQDALSATSPKERTIPTDTQWERPMDPEFGEDNDPTKPQTPKKKGFMERLIDKKIADQMGENRGTQAPNTPDVGKGVNSPTIAQPPGDREITGPKTPGWTPTGNPKDATIPNRAPIGVPKTPKFRGPIGPWKVPKLGPKF
jgi:hypothetical protein